MDTPVKAIRRQIRQISANASVAEAESAEHPQGEPATDSKPLFINVYLRLNCSN
jgi:hypothetical protein